MSTKQLAAVVMESLAARLPEQRKTQREALGIMVAVMLEVRSPNTVDLASGLPRAAERLDMRLQWVSRVLANPHIIPHEVMSPFAREALEKVAKHDKTLVISIDQSHISAGFEMLMVSLRHKSRAIPLLWLVRKTSGGIGFAAQKELLDQITKILPENAKIVLMGDRFYGTPDLIDYCRNQGWDWRLRLKENFTLWHNGEETSLAKLAQNKEQRFLKNVAITRKATRTNIGIVREKGHKEPWIIAMSATPTYYKTMDYGMRWGIECMFSDLKSRGFSLAETQLRYADRIERLVLIMALALYWATSCGLWDELNHPVPYEKKKQKSQPQPDVAVQTRTPLPPTMPHPRPRNPSTLERICLN